MISFIRNSFQKMFKCNLDSHCLDRESVLWNGHHYYGVCGSCHCIIRRQAKDAWKRWPAYPAKRLYAGAQLADGSAFAQEKVAHEKAIKKAAVRTSIMGEPGSPEVGTLQDSQ